MVHLLFFGTLSSFTTISQNLSNDLCLWESIFLSMLAQQVTVQICWAHIHTHAHTHPPTHPHTHTHTHAHTHTHTGTDRQTHAHTYAYSTCKYTHMNTYSYIIPKIYSILWSQNIQNNATILLTSFREEIII